MLKFFQKPKLTIHSISVPDLGWTKEKETESIIQWINPDQAMALSVNFFPMKPDIPTVKDINTIRKFFRNNIVKQNGGLIYVDFLKVADLVAVKTIFKIPQDPSGMTYLASCTIPFYKYSYVVKIQAPELGITGFREMAIADRMRKEKKVSQIDEGWSSDPYDATFKDGNRMNVAEDEKYDSQFPNHPLTRARKFINEIIPKIEFADEVYKVKEFQK